MGSALGPVTRETLAKPFSRQGSVPELVRISFTLTLPAAAPLLESVLAVRLPTVQGAVPAGTASGGEVDVGVDASVPAAAVLREDDGGPTVAEAGPLGVGEGPLELQPENRKTAAA